jgi:hypothetical protein
MVHTASAARSNDTELLVAAVKTAMHHEHNHEYHHAMPLGVMLCVYCGERKNAQMNRLMPNHWASRAKRIAVRK